MWFWLSLIALLCWSGSDLFSKIGCKDQDDRLSHLKMVTAVGVVMGLHAAYEIFIGGVEINFQILLTYLPVSALYIASMAIGYIGLRYIELSISCRFNTCDGWTRSRKQFSAFGCGVCLRRRDSAWRCGSNGG